jgi:hypothetical protein
MEMKEQTVMAKYYPPKYWQSSFNCIHCDVYSTQEWGELYYKKNSLASQLNTITYCICSHCDKWSFWHEGKMIIPSEASVPPAHIDMPTECLLDYNEAREIVAKSPRAASALMRLSLQKLMAELGEKGKNINDDIGSLVSKGLHSEVQQALDFCRVVGNNAVHPGEIDIKDNPEIALNLFTMMNFIVEERISRPKKTSILFNALPQGAREAIDKRDS